MAPAATNPYRRGPHSHPLPTPEQQRSGGRQPPHGHPPETDRSLRFPPTHPLHTPVTRPASRRPPSQPRRRLQPVFHPSTMHRMLQPPTRPCVVPVGSRASPRRGRHAPRPTLTSALPTLLPPPLPPHHRASTRALTAQDKMGKREREQKANKNQARPPRSGTNTHATHPRHGPARQFAPGTPPRAGASGRRKVGSADLARGGTLPTALPALLGPRQRTCGRPPPPPPKRRAASAPTRPPTNKARGRQRGGSARQTWRSYTPGRVGAREGRHAPRDGPPQAGNGRRAPTGGYPHGWDGAPQCGPHPVSPRPASGSLPASGKGTRSGRQGRAEGGTDLGACVAIAGGRARGPRPRRAATRAAATTGGERGGGHMGRAAQRPT